MKIRRQKYLLEAAVAFLLANGAAGGWLRLRPAMKLSGIPALEK
jgi:hypothetical protein